MEWGQEFGFFSYNLLDDIENLAEASIFYSKKMIVPFSPYIIYETTKCKKEEVLFPMKVDPCLTNTYWIEAQLESTNS